MAETHEFFFLRHGETEGNQAQRLQGQTDTRLTERGRVQARWLAERWAQAGVRFDQIISSPLERARQTAEIIAAILPAPLEQDAIWMERNFGILEGEYFRDLRQRIPTVDYYHPYAGFEGSGETQTDLYVRALQAVQGLVQRPAGCYLVVTHGAFLGRICFAILGLSPVGQQGGLIFRIENTGYLRALYETEKKRWTILSITNPAELAGPNLEGA
jgi:probable phosphoglycerate mutase